MNQVQTIFASLSDAQLKAVVQDIIVLDDTGVLPDGPERSLATRLNIEARVPFKDALTLAQRECIRIAAFKWATA